MTDTRDSNTLWRALRRIRRVRRRVFRPGTWGLTVLLLALGIWMWSLLTPAPEAQATALTSTTLAAVVSTADATTVTLTSGTGVTANTTVLYIDREMLRVQTAVGGSTTTWNVVRGFDGTVATAHMNAARVWLGVRERFYRADVVDRTPCTANNELYFPHINAVTGQIAECEGGFWSVWSDDPVNVKTGTIRDNFDGNYNVMQDDGTVKSLTDTEENFVQGSPLGAIEYREEQTKTASSWITINGYLDVSGDNTTSAEGVEIIFGANSDAVLGQYIEAGTQGACIAASITFTDISGTNLVNIGFRQNEAWQDAVGVTSYTVWSGLGQSNVDGSITSREEVSGATQTDDSGVDIADAETRALKVCVSRAGVPTAYYSASYTPSLTLTDRPLYIQIPNVNTGLTYTAGTGMIPFFAFLVSGTDGPDIRVNWLELTRLP